MKVADLIALLAPLSERHITLCCGDRVVDLERESLTVVDENTAAFYLPAPPAPVSAPTLAVALDVLATWVKQAEQRIADLEGNSSTGDIDYSELAGEIDLSDLAGYLDVDDTVTEAVNDTLRYARLRIE